MEDSVISTIVSGDNLFAFIKMISLPLSLCIQSS